MRPRILSRLVLLLAVGLLVTLSACGGGKEEPPATAPSESESTASRNGAAAPSDTIPAKVLPAFLEAHREGLGHMERYEYGEAVKNFRKALELAPNLNAAKVNLAIALLNDTGVKAEEAKKNRSATPATNFDEALALLDEVLAGDPNNLHARYCRGIILEYLGQMARAHEDYKFVVEHDPSDAHAWVKFGMTLPDPKRPNFPASLDQAEQLVEIYGKALERNPYLVLALFKLQEAYNWASVKARRDRPDEAATLAGKRDEISKLWDRLNPDRNVAGHGETGKTFYGEMGHYATLLDPFATKIHRAESLVPPRFESLKPLAVELPAGHRWVQRADFDGPLAVVGRFRDRFGAAVAHLDVNGDGQRDLVLAAAVKGPNGVRDVLLLNQGDGRFEDASAAFGLPDDRVSLGVAAADFDADGQIDLFLTGVGDNRLLRNKGGKTFEDITSALGETGPKAISPTARWLDLDQDGDLDLVVLNYTAAEQADAAFKDAASPPPGLPNTVYRNDGQPPKVENTTKPNWAPIAVAPESVPATEGLSIVLTPWNDETTAAIRAGEAPHTGLAVLDLDEDRDLDLVLSADQTAPTAALNDRLGRFHEATLKDLAANEPVNGLLVLDLDQDGRSDLVAVHPAGRLSAWRNVRVDQKDQKAGFAFEFWPIDARSWRSAMASDLDLDGWIDLVGLPVSGEAEAPRWARNEGSRLASQDLALGPDSTASLVGLDLADLVGDPLPEILLVRDGDGPRMARNLGNGHHWLALDLDGRWKFGFDHMRTNPHGLGTRLTLQGPGLDVPYSHTTTTAGPAQSVGPVVLGLGQTAPVPLVRLRWPDGVMQAELNVDADQLLALAEHNRKTGSCPVLFTFDGQRFVCLGDFLGGGGLGYLVAPGVYGEPDRDESVAIAGDQLRPVGGVYRLSITEPMDEVAYLDHLTLDVVDRPPGVEATPDERFAPGGNRPTGALIAWKSTIEPLRATDLKGHDVTEALRAWDRRTVDGFRRLRGWIGYAEEHGIVLDFGDRLSRFGPDDRLVLCLAGWVEYPYSQTNYAASTAGVPLRPPVLERLRNDGSWEVLEVDPGYPAGLPRRTTLDLTGKLTGPKCVIRLRTNMECYWDQAFVAVAEPQPGLRVHALPVARAKLGYRGYTREVSPDGNLPLLYDYDYVDPAPLARLEGQLTRAGDVARLLQNDDDHLCVVGPGDEIRLEFEAKAVPPLPEGWTRSFVLRAVGYCKDADPFTASSDRIGPLPWRGMPAYPFGPEGERPMDPSYKAYLKEFQTRPVAP